MPVDRHAQPVRSCPDSDTSGPQLRNGELAIRAHRGGINKFQWNQTSSVSDPVGSKSQGVGGGERRGQAGGWGRGRQLSRALRTLKSAQTATRSLPRGAGQGKRTETLSDSCSQRIRFHLPHLAAKMPYSRDAPCERSKWKSSGQHSETRQVTLNTGSKSCICLCSFFYFSEGKKDTFTLA